MSLEVRKMQLMHLEKLDGHLILKDQSEVAWRDENDSDRIQETSHTNKDVADDFSWLDR